MKHVNKFNVHWQIVRMNAKSIKDVGKKLDYVRQFLMDRKNIHNYYRVYNWAKMSSYAYKEIHVKNLYYNLLMYLDEHIDDFSSELDDYQDFDDYKLEDILKLRKDLNGRKYDFFYDGVPKSHKNFMVLLDSYLEELNYE